jgi:hypothetical protein
MSVETTDRKTTQTMTIALVEYVFSFRALYSSPSDIKCVRTNIATNTDEVMTYVTEIPSPSAATDVLKYLVDVNEDGIGGVVTVCWPSTGSTITIYRETTDVQSSDYEDYNQFPANTVENDFDKRTMRSQELAEDVNRALKYGITAPSGGTLPTGVANNLLGWDATGTVIENKNLITSGTVLLKASATDAIAKTDDTLYMTPHLVGLAARTIGTLVVTTQATIPIAIVTSLTATTITISNSTITADRSRSITVENPTGSENISMFYVDNNITIDQIVCILEGTTPSVTWGVKHGASRNGAGTSVVTATTTDVTSGATITAFADATVPSKSHIWFVTTATSGTITSLNLTINYKQDA